MAEGTKLPATIIFVEDDQDVGHLIGFHLKRAGFVTLWFRTATGVIAEAERRKPALFLLDLMLPGVDGFHLCRSIRKHHLLRTVPIVVLTARAGRQDRELAFKSGADDYITKPFRPADLMSRVRALSERQG
jgi:DNA-binding response OmpR family regulator